MASFLDTIRMNNIFGGGTPVGMPNLQGPSLDFFSDMLNRALPALEASRRREKIFDLEHRDRKPVLGEVGFIADKLAGKQPQQIQQPMNTIYGGDIKSSPFKNTLDEAEAKRHDPQFKNYITTDKDKDKNQAKLEEIAAQLNREKEITALRGQNTIAAEKEKGSQTRQTEEVKTSGRKDVEEVKGDQTRKTEDVKNTGKMALAGQIMNINDPHNPGKQISVIVKPDGTVLNAELNKEQIGPSTKPGTPNQVPATAKDIEKQQILRKMTNEALAGLNELVDEKGNLKPDIQWGVGWSNLGGFAPYIPTSPQKTASKKIRQVIAKQVLGLVSEMKSQTKTGATGFGNMSNKDLGLLEDAASALDPNMSESDFAKEVVKMRDLISKSLQSREEDKDHDSIVDGLLKKYGVQ